MKKYIKMICGIVIFVIILAVLMIVIVPKILNIHFVDYDTMLLEESNFNAQWVRPLIVDGVSVCEFSSDRENDFKVWDRGKTYTLKRALKKKIVTLKQLQKAGLPCR